MFQSSTNYKNRQTRRTRVPYRIFVGGIFIEGNVDHTHFYTNYTQCDAGQHLDHQSPFMAWPWKEYMLATTWICFALVLSLLTVKCKPQSIKNYLRSRVRNLGRPMCIAIKGPQLLTVDFNQVLDTYKQQNYRIDLESLVNNLI